MENAILVLYAVPALVTICLLLIVGKRASNPDNHFLNNLVILQAAIYLGISVWLGGRVELPLYFFRSEYFYIDRLSVYEILITSTVFLLASIYARGYVSSLLKTGDLDTSVHKFFYGAFCLLEMLIILGLSANNIALLWIFLELSTILTAVLIVTLNARENIIAALKYIFIASTAMLFGFIGIIILFTISHGITEGGSLNWTTLMDAAASLDPTLFNFAFIFLFIGFAAKAGIAPFHTWVPTAYVRAPSVVAVVSGTVLNMGIYAILRLYAIGNQSGAGDFLQTFLLVFGLLSIIIAAFSMLMRTNTKKLLAFSGVENMGFLILTIGLGSPVALFWGLFHQMAYSFIKSLLFFCAGIFHRQYGSNKYFAVQNAFKLQPLASWGFIIGSAAAIGIPLFPVFLSKWNILGVLISESVPAFIILLVCILLVAAGFAVFLIKTFSRKTDDVIQPFVTPINMKVSVLLALGIIIVLGVYMPSWLDNTLGTIVADLGL
jgi:hydrogenase-4 component F